jgi:beta-lactam-binding protein with PASTA domain
MNKKTIKDFFKRIVNHWMVKTPLIAAAIIASGIIIFFISLHIITRHGQGFQVPDFSGMNKYDAEQLAQKKRLRFEVSDSVYIMTREPGSVIDQNPSPGTFVKARRRVFVTVNAQNPLLVEMPNVVGVTLRQAKSILDLQGFRIGYLSFTPDIAVNNVLEQRYDGKQVEPGELIPKGSTVDLVLGKGFSNQKTALPRVIGLSLSEARNVLIEASLNMGKLRFDETVKDYRDSLEAKIYSQYPNLVGEISVAFGARVDLWLTLNESRIPKEVEPKKEDVKHEIIYKEPEEEILE